MGRWRVLQACGGGVVLELNKKQDESVEKRNLFCFTANENRVILEPIGQDMYRFDLEKLEQTDFTYIEFLFNEHDNLSFYLPGKMKIKREIHKAILTTSDGVPYLAPEVVLFYKSSYLDGFNAADHNQDFNSSVAYFNPFNPFNPEQKQWLKEALEKEYPNGHAWLQRLNYPENNS
ncbi:hypothetical protein ACHHV8_14010 [Paenibacillus sp. TAB 01]|uniref:hypothetical protein n=1 Tax=Paenibacillus sp. TAB 01 TaxID=3368988 RepID=UPI003752B1A7